MIIEAEIAQAPATLQVASSIDVQVYIPHMTCLSLSEESGPNNDRDEIYLLVGGTPAELGRSTRLPRYVGNDSYYEYNVGQAHDADASWTNHDQAPVGRPVLWTGTLADGQSAEFLVTIMEQDNNSIGVLKDLLATGLNAADSLFGSNATAKAIITAARDLAKYLPESKGHDFIGAFAIQVANRAGRLQATFVPIQGAPPTNASEIADTVAAREQAQVAVFDCSSPHSSAHYRVVPAARLGPRLPTRTYLGRTEDNCGEALLAVEGGPRPYKGFYHIAKGEIAWVPLAGPRFTWYCGMSEERAVGPDSTNLVQVHRSASGREIIWYCYNESADGFRPTYHPTQTWVKLSTELDLCGEQLLVVEGIGGFYHLAPGQQRWVPISQRQFRWYGDITPEAAVGPEGTNLLRVTRNPQTRRVTWECCREIVSLRPYTTPDDTKVLIGRESDECSAERLKVRGAGGFYHVDKGEQKWVPIDDRSFHWICGVSVERSVAPEGTNLLLVKRHAIDREVSWLCYSSILSTAAYHQPDSFEALLGTETDQCSNQKLTIAGAAGKVVIAKGQQNIAVPVASHIVDWWCGNSLEHTDTPMMTNLIKVSRASEGREITMTCFWHLKAEPNPPADIMAATFSGADRVDVYTRNPRRMIMGTSSSDTAGADWPAPWAEIPSGVFLSGPAACASADGRQVHVFGRGNDNKIWRAYSPDGGASWDLAWAPIGAGVFLSGPAATISADGRSLHVFGRGLDNAIWRAYSPDGGASWDLAWAPIPEGVFTSGPAACASADGRQVHVFGRGNDNRIWRAYSPDGGASWTYAWGPIGEGVFISSPAAAISPDGRTVHVFGIGMDHRIWRAYSLDGGSTWPLAWAPIDGGTAL